MLHSGNIGIRNPACLTLSVPRGPSLRIPRTSRNRKRGLFRRFLLNHPLVVAALCCTQENYGPSIPSVRPFVRLLNLTRCSFIVRPWKKYLWREIKAANPTAVFRGPLLCALNARREIAAQHQTRSVWRDAEELNAFLYFGARQREGDEDVLEIERSRVNPRHPRWSFTRRNPPVVARFPRPCPSPSFSLTDFSSLRSPSSSLPLHLSWLPSDLEICAHLHGDARRRC